MLEPVAELPPGEAYMASWRTRLACLFFVFSMVVRNCSQVEVVDIPFEEGDLVEDRPLIPFPSTPETIQFA